MPDECYLIGSREELLHARGDLIHNPALGIVDALKSVAERIAEGYRTADAVVTTVYLETYGGKTTAAAKQYTSKQEFGYRVFDVNRVSLDRLENDTESIAAWRENGGQEFLSEAELTEFVTSMGLRLTPRVSMVDGLPTSIEEAHRWLSAQLTAAMVALDDQAGGKPEGLVVRTADRRKIAKLRFEDYERHAKGVGKSKR